MKYPASSPMAEFTAAEYDGSEIAVVGLACRFPGANDPNTYWLHLRDGVSSVRHLSDDELRAAGISEQRLAEASYVKAAAFLDEPEYFDAGFFGMSPREAEITDPQHRILLELAQHALEDAGQTPQGFAGRIGVFAGATLNSYLVMNLARHPSALADLEPVQLNIGNGGDFLTTRIAYKLNLTGPCYTVQSACSTSLVAVHAACESLLSEEADLALAGGASINVGFRHGYDYAEGGMMSPDGVCRPFDAKAQGTLFGSGAGLVALRRLEDALEDGDHIYAVVRGTAINNDGSLKVGYTAPSVEGQARVVREALDSAGLTADDIDYVEAHGTATPLGDPIEIQALNKAWRPDTERRGFCAIGSVKGNLGHLDAAAGIAGFIKSVLALQHRQMPPSLHFERPNPGIDFAKSPFYVNGTLRDWPGQKARRAAVSAFGVGGTNAHVILEEAPERAAETESSAEPRLLLLSAKSPAALDSMSSSLADSLGASPAGSLRDVAFTLAQGRQTFEHRRVAVATDLEAAVAELRREGIRDRWNPDKERPLAFVFSGQGSQRPQMARGLYKAYPEFKKAVDGAASTLESTLGFDFREVLFPAAGDEEAASERLKDTALAQVVLFVVEHALASLLMQWGLRPKALVGHSIGEYVAATLAGVFTYGQALKLVAARGRLMSALPTGAMLSVPLGEEDVSSYLEVGLNVALVNAPDRVVISGPEGLIVDLAERLRADDVQSRRLQTSHAFHSAMMQGAVEPLAEQIRSMELGTPMLPFLSNLTGTWIKDEEARDPEYWARHLRQTVRFADNIGELLGEEKLVLLEVGPGDMLTRLARRHPAAGPGHRFIASLAGAPGRSDELAGFLACLGRLWAAGMPLDWGAFFAAEKCRRVSLPGYAFERKRFWIEPDLRAATASMESPSPDGVLIKNGSVDEWLYEMSWRRAAKAPWIPSELEDGAGWLILGDGRELEEDLVRRLRDAGQEVLRVHAEGAAAASTSVETLDSSDPSAWRRVVESWAASDALPRHIVHLWQLGEGSDGEGGFESAQERGLYSVLHLVQAFEEVAPGQEMDLLVVSDGAFAVTEMESLDPRKATLSGGLTVISQEYPHRRCRQLDLRGAHRRAEIILGAAQGSGCRSMAVRGSQVWEASFDRWPAAAPRQAPGAAKRLLRRGGVYLITGGLEEIGVEQAEYLASSYGARLALQVDGDFPPEPTWDEFLAVHGTHRMSTQIRAARRLKELAGDMVLLPADADDAASMADLPARAARQFGALHGFIHNGRLTGERSFRTVADSTRETCAWQLGPKVHSLRHLAPSLAAYELDFCLLNSSMSSLLGGYGTFAYAAANAYLDAFAHEMARRGKGRWMAVNWEAWQRTQIAGLSPDVARLALDGAEGAEVLERILTTEDGENPVRLVISTVDFDRRREAWAAQGHFSASAEVEPENRGSRAPRPDLETLYQAPSSELEKLVAGVFERTLGIEKVGVLDNFFDLGGDSLVAVQTASQLEKVIGRRIPVVDLYDGLTVQSLAAAIEGLEAADRGVDEAGADAASAEENPEKDRRERRARGRESQLQQRARRQRRRQPTR